MSNFPTVDLLWKHLLVIDKPIRRSRYAHVSLARDRFATNRSLARGEGSSRSATLYTHTQELPTVRIYDLSEMLVRGENAHTNLYWELVLNGNGNEPSGTYLGPGTLSQPHPIRFLLPYEKATDFVPNFERITLTAVVRELQEALTFNTFHKIWDSLQGGGGVAPHLVGLRLLTDDEERMRAPRAQGGRLPTSAAGGGEGGSGTRTRTRGRTRTRRRKGTTRRRDPFTSSSSDEEHDEMMAGERDEDEDEDEEIEMQRMHNRLVVNGCAYDNDDDDDDDDDDDEVEVTEVEEVVVARRGPTSPPSSGGRPVTRGSTRRAAATQNGIKKKTNHGDNRNPGNQKYTAPPKPSSSSRRVNGRHARGANRRGGTIHHHQRESILDIYAGYRQDAWLEAGNAGFAELATLREVISGRGRRSDDLSPGLSESGSDDADTNTNTASDEDHTRKGATPPPPYHYHHHHHHHAPTLPMPLPLPAPIRFSTPGPAPPAPAPSLAAWLKSLNQRESRILAREVWQHERERAILVREAAVTTREVQLHELHAALLKRVNCGRHPETEADGGGGDADPADGGEPGEDGGRETTMTMTTRLIDVGGGSMQEVEEGEGEEEKEGSENERSGRPSDPSPLDASLTPDNVAEKEEMNPSIVIPPMVIPPMLPQIPDARCPYRFP